MKQSQRIILALVLLAALVAAGVVVWRSAADDGDAEVAEGGPDEDDAALAWTAGPRPWETDDKPADAVLNVGDDGPALVLSPDAELLLGMVPEGAEGVRWETTETDEGIVFEGTGTFRGAELTLQWTFASGNPQAAFHARIHGIELAQLATPITASLALPVGDVRYVDRSMRVSPFAGDPISIDPWTPGWLQWTGEGRSLTVAGWWADRVRIVEGETTPGVTVNFDLWHPEHRPIGPDCTPKATTDVEARLQLVLGAPPALFTSRFEGGARAAVAPVFVSPHDHPNTMMKDAAASDGAAWADRARTLVFGHSSPEDPRHGNGGLLGAELGGTLVVPAKFAEAPAVAALSKETEGTSVDIGVTGAEAHEFAEVLYPTETCSRLEEPSSLTAKTLLGRTLDYDGGYQNLFRATAPTESAITPGVSPTFPTVFHALRLDGTRTQLVDQMLSTLYLERMVAERGMVVFEAPLVATRNPLIKAAQHALLAPERNGQWTLDPRLVRAIADIELLLEASPIAFRGLSRLVKHWRGARRSELWFDAEGNVDVVQGGGTTRGLTVVTDGAVRFEAEPNAIDGQRANDAADSPQTWVWLDTTEDASVKLTPNEPFALEPVEWILRTNL